MSISHNSWPCASEPPSLQKDDVHVWRVALDPPDSRAQELRALLTDDETQRTDRFRFAEHRKHFTVARGTLRLLLARYADIAPEELRFTYNEYGKPALPGDAAQDIRFNLSHSGELALYAVALGRELGIDIECMRPMQQAEQIARRFFSDAEHATFCRLPADARQQAFFNCWTRKEAYIKARGRGLNLPLDQFDVSLIPGEAAQLLATRDDPAQCAHWTMQALDPGPGYAAALMVEGGGWRVRCRQFS